MNSQVITHKYSLSEGLQYYIQNISNNDLKLIFTSTNLKITLDIPKIDKILNK